ncbi:hypothetical protein ACFU44_16060 [Nocardia rhizosphaerihabitans]|uniref:hypothetical protein n=1 Tax=Nocardia rhizosphaerihabitans TaxID=1691570 RepID=UPI003670FF97
MERRVSGDLAVVVARKVIDDVDLVPGVEQQPSHGGADVASATGDEDLHVVCTFIARRWSWSRSG